MVQFVSNKISYTRNWRIQNSTVWQLNNGVYVGYWLDVAWAEMTIPNPRVFMDISIGGRDIGRMVFEVSMT